MLHLLPFYMGQELKGCAFKLRLHDGNIYIHYRNVYIIKHYWNYYWSYHIMSSPQPN